MRVKAIQTGEYDRSPPDSPRLYRRHHFHRQPRPARRIWRLEFCGEARGNQILTSTGLSRIFRLLETAGLASADRGIARLLRRRQQGRPLVNYVDEFGVIWSAKSASTNVVVWFFLHMNLLDDVQAYDSWPHRYREHVFHKSKEYVDGVARVSLSRIPWLRVIRDPYQRSVSSYRYAIRHGYEDERIGQFLGRGISRRDGFSFIEFLNYLSSIDIASCNVHHSEQVNRIERFSINKTVINIDKTDLDEGLRAFERSQGLVWTAERATAYASLLNRTAARLKTAQSGPIEPKAAEKRFSKTTGREGWPEYASFLNDETRARIRAIYWRDFDAYAAWL